MAKRSSERLQSPTDTDYHNIFKRIFKVDRNDQTKYDLTKLKDMTPYELVQGSLSSVANDWKDAGDGDDARRDSNVRIYCSNGKGWQAMGGGLFGDQRNWVVGTDDPCTDGEEAITTTGTLRIPANEKSHNPNRAVIELCDTLFRDRGYAMRLDDISIVRDLQGLPGGIRTFKLMPSATLLHEFLHLLAYDIDDKYNGNDEAYGWDKVFAKQLRNAKGEIDSLDNADSYLYFALWALIADRRPMNQALPGLYLPGGYTLPRQSSPLDQQDEDDAKAGKIRLYPDLTDGYNPANPKKNKRLSFFA